MAEVEINVEDELVLLNKQVYLILPCTHTCTDRKLSS